MHLILIIFQGKILHHNTLKYFYLTTIINFVILVLLTRKKLSLYSPKHFPSIRKQ